LATQLLKAEKPAGVLAKVLEAFTKTCCWVLITEKQALKSSLLRSKPTAYLRLIIPGGEKKGKKSSHVGVLPVVFTRH
jgi:hypothetical protein